MNPLDEDSQELLIRAYARAGDRTAALHQRDACVALFRRGLGTSPAQAVLRAAEPEPQSAPPARTVTKAGIAAGLEAGLAAMDASPGRTGFKVVADRRGDRETAIRWLAEARTRCTRLPDAWLWVEGYCLDALCRLATQHGRPEAAPWIAGLEALATRTGMRELVARAYLHRGGSGDRNATDAARVLAAEVDNPAILTVDR